MRYGWYGEGINKRCIRYNDNGTSVPVGNLNCGARVGGGRRPRKGFRRADGEFGENDWASGVEEVSDKLFGELEQDNDLSSEGKRESVGYDFNKQDIPMFDYADGDSDDFFGADGDCQIMMNAGGFDDVSTGDMYAEGVYSDQASVGRGHYVAKRGVTLWHRKDDSKVFERNGTLKEGDEVELGRTFTKTHIVSGEPRTKRLVRIVGTGNNVSIGAVVRGALKKVKNQSDSSPAYNGGSFFRKDGFILWQRDKREPFYVATKERTKELQPVRGIEGVWRLKINGGAKKDDFAKLEGYPDFFVLVSDLLNSRKQK